MDSTLIMWQQSQHPLVLGSVRSSFRPSLPTLHAIKTELERRNPETMLHDFSPRRTINPFFRSKLVLPRAWSHFVVWKWLYMFAFLSVCLTLGMAIKKIFRVGSAGLSTMTTNSSAALMKNTPAVRLLECAWLHTCGWFSSFSQYYYFSNTLLADSSSAFRI